MALLILYLNLNILWLLYQLHVDCRAATSAATQLEALINCFSVTTFAEDIEGVAILSFGTLRRWIMTTSLFHRSLLTTSYVIATTTKSTYKTFIIHCGLQNQQIDIIVATYALATGLIRPGLQQEL